jgi:hypothetical protein
MSVLHLAIFGVVLRETPPLPVGFRNSLSDDYEELCLL